METILIILLTLATAAVHASFFVADPASQWIFGLNALGYISLLALLYLPLPLGESVHHLVRRLLMAFAAVTIAAYIGFGLTTGVWTIPLGPIDKLMEITLIGLLWLQERQPTSVAVGAHR
jgi:hypothetical protein